MTLDRYSSRNEIAGTFGVVASSHWIASQVGMSILERGGNAFDAAVAAGMTMQVVDPQQNSLGGETVILFQPAGAQSPRVICGQGVVPQGATIDRFESLGLSYVPATGVLSAVVPGAFDGWLRLLSDYGTCSVVDVLYPAIEYAHSGYPVTQSLASRLEKSKALLTEKWTSSAEIYLPGAAAPAAGTLLRNRILGETYTRLMKESEAAGGSRERRIEAARNAFYEGFVAEAISNFVANPVGPNGHEMCARGFLNANDMSDWCATYEDPVYYDLDDCRVYKPGSWTQGPAFLQVLSLVRQLDIFAYSPFSAEYVHVLVEATKLAFADRDAWYGDVNVNEAPLSYLLSDEYNTLRARLIGVDASKDFRPGEVPNRVLNPPKFRTNISGGLDVQLLVTDPVAPPGSGDTCHIDVIDRHGNVVAATPSGGWFWGSPTIPELGFALNTRAQMSWLQKGVSSALMPGTRPRTTLSPTIATRRSESPLAFGSRGADYQDQWLAQFLFRHVKYGFDLQSAIDAPMFQSDHTPRSDYPRDATPCKVTMDDRFSNDVISELRERGHDVRIQEGKRFGPVCAAARENDILRAAAASNPPQCYAVGR